MTDTLTAPAMPAASTLSATLFVVAAPEVLAHARDLVADRAHALEHGIDEVLVLGEMRAAFLGDAVELLGAVGLCGDAASSRNVSVG